jgi:lysophospholipase L1-like esterase
MRIRLISLSVLVMLCGAGVVRGAEGPTYYLALGDSLAVGVQPSASGDISTNQGYVDDLYALSRLRIPGLALAKLGCSGETTTSMINGGMCEYSEGSQLKAAVSFLETHRVRLVTLDIGGDDVDHCFNSTNVEACVEAAIPTLSNNLVSILEQLRAAAGHETLIVAMNYYDPFLAAWTLGPSGQTLARESVTATTGFNGVLESIYSSFEVPVADVARAYRITNFTTVPDLDLPLNVLLTLTWTWTGAPPPLGPDIHPNAAGYAVIAGAFAKTIATL